MFSAETTSMHKLLRREETKILEERIWFCHTFARKAGLEEKKIQAGTFEGS